VNLQRLVMLVVALALASLTPAFAHEVRPALLQLTENDSGGYEAVFKQPVVGELAIRLEPRLSGGALDGPVTAETVTDAYRIRTWRAPPGSTPLSGQTLTIVGLERSVTDVLVRATTRSGEQIDAVVRPSEPTLLLELEGSRGVAVPAYLSMGVEHILTGADHLMFVLGLLIWVGLNGRLVKAVTAFTVAHSITLALAALDLVRFDSDAIEALVALSLVFLALELLRSGPGGAGRRPWMLAFAFGLLHGLAFAGLLAEVGLPEGAVVPALFMFNLGVEIGQLLFIVTAAALLAGLRSALRRRAGHGERPVRVGLAYAIGGVASFWFLERLVAATSTSAAVA
jgi:hypothetical protein